MRKVGYIVSALLLLAVAMGPAVAQQPFSDVPTSHWAYNAVNTLAEQGLLEGYPDGAFKGKQSLTRYEFAQAVARMMDRMEQMGGVPGSAGPPGPPGPGAGAGLTPEQQAVLDKLAKEFGPELKALRSDLDALTQRVEDLEAKPEPELPKINVSGSMNWRAGMYGTVLGTEDAEATGYPWFEELMIDGGEVVAPYGGINVPGIGSIPITDALKDAYKASDFMTLKTKVSLSGDLTETVGVNVTLLAGPETNRINSPGSFGLFGSPVFFSGNGMMDSVAVDEAWVKWQTKFITPVDVVVGKQYFDRGQGLLVDNDQEAIKAFRIDWSAGALSWGAIWGMLDREQFWAGSTGVLGLPALDAMGMYAPAGIVDPTTSGQDNYNVYTLGWAITDSWNLGTTWLDSGFNEEQGYSLDLAGEAWGLDWYGEYAQLRNWPTGQDFNDLNGDGVEDANEAELDGSDTAWLAGVKWNSDFVNITGEYGEVDAGYAFTLAGGGWSPLNPLLGAAGMYTDFFNLPLSALHPNAAVDPHDINWIDRPLFLDPTNIARGWHVNVTFPTLLGEGTPLSVSYMDGDGYDPGYLGWLAAGGSKSAVAEPDKWRDADQIWVVELSRQFSENMSANLLYGYRKVNNIMSPQTVPITTIDDVDLFAENEPIQVLRAEVCVAF